MLFVTKAKIEFVVTMFVANGTHATKSGEASIR